MNKNYFTLTIALLFVSFFAFAQDTTATEEPPKAWQTGAGMGLDFAQLFQLNPRQGAGQNRVGLGGAINFFANYKKDRIAWDNLSSWQFGLQRLGSGVIAQGATEKIPFQKAIDELRLNSKIGYKTAESSKFFYAANFSFLSQLLSTYNDPGLPGNFPKALSDTSIFLSKLFAPATITISAGIDYKPTEKLSFYYSPLGGKFIIVGNDIIAATGVHGNPVDKDGQGNIIGFDNVLAQLGSLLRVNYSSKFMEDRLAFSSAILFFSNYLENPQNIDVDWTNELAITVIKNLQLSATLNVFYDDDVRVQVTDYDAPNGVNGVGKRVSLTQQLLLKYNVVF
ncbi:MAG: DUF3078 domain-containing protein [Saprospiraceae bacterium]|nr:DUF3078 domain-containing protein [Saprospiraceae bacterium]